MSDPEADATNPPAPRRGVVLPFHRPLVRARDAAWNAEWDRLLDLSREAWTWRDPESLEALETTLNELRAHVMREWYA